VGKVKDGVAGIASGKIEGRSRDLVHLLLGFQALSIAQHGIALRDIHDGLHIIGVTVELCCFGQFWVNFLELY
jgi:hypothetical protein